MLLTDARRPARSGPGGELIPLAEQDRTRWDRRLIAAGLALITGALRPGSAGEYQLQAPSPPCTTRRAAHTATDWPQILTLYGLLESMTGNPMVTLNRAVAAAMAHGPGAGLALLDGLDERLGDHHRLALRPCPPPGAGRRRARPPPRSSVLPPPARPTSANGTT